MGLRARPGKSGGAPGAAAAAAGRGGPSGGHWKDLVRCLFDPAAARDLPPDSTALRTLEAGENPPGPHSLLPPLPNSISPAGGRESGRQMESIDHCTD